MNLLQRMRGGGARDITSVDEYIEAFNQFGFQGIGYGISGYGSTLAPSPLQTTMGGQMTEMAPDTFVGLARQAYGANGVVFACMLVRMLVFSSIRFQWQRMRNGHASDLFGDRTLRLLEKPWQNGTTQDLLIRSIQDADLAGNSYWYRDQNELVRLRPDFMDVVVAPRMMRGQPNGQIGWKVFGYVYYERGYGAESEPVGFLPSEIAHFAPIPDPLANYRGMSWLTPILREIQSDQAMSRHQIKFFDNGATPNMVVKHDAQATLEKIKKFAKEMKDEFGGIENAYKTLHLYPGADATVVGANMRQIDFETLREGGEVRVAAAAGVPPVIVGLTKGLDSATYSNYGQARRRLADGTAHPLWQNLAGSLETVVPPPDDASRLWYDTTDVPFLREDEGDRATIANTKATTINTYITAGFEPDSVVKAVDSGDLGLLVHTGLTSVQLIKPGQDNSGDNSGSGTDTGAGAADNGSDPTTNGQPQPSTGGNNNGSTVPANA